VRRVLLAALVVAGCALRLWWYLFDRSLWWDEAAVVLNVLRKPPLALFGPLDFDQAAPVGFLLGLKFAIWLFGDGERVVRLVPLLCGLSSVPIFVWVAQKYASRMAAPLAAGFFALTPMLIYWSSDGKPYMSDVLLTVLALWAGAITAERGLSGRHAVGLAIFGALALFCSFPMLFVLPGIGLVLFWHAASHHRAADVRRLAAVGGVWGCAAAIYYTATLRHLNDNALLKAMWDGQFLSVGDILGSYRLMASAFRVPAGLVDQHAWPLVPLWLAGWWAVFRRCRVSAALLAAPVVLLAAASLFRLYPFSHRTILFLAPLVFLPLAEGVVLFVRSVSVVSRPAAIGIAAVLAVALSRTSVVNIVRGPQPWAEIRPLLAHVRQHAQEGDTIYVGEFEPVYLYYRSRFGLAGRPYVAGRSINVDWQQKDVTVLDGLHGRHRVWAISSDDDFGRRLDARGRRLEAFGNPDDVELYLYDFSADPGGGTPWA
jgi:4-amino-4-deoxy-L-arabinose transferase-like glycosyltransferase